jgi:hypothetical protein
MGSSDLFWLYTVNIALGVVTFVGVAILAVSVVREVLQRRARRVAAFDDHVFHLPELGATMADGGERIEPPASAEKPPQGH